MIRTVVKMVKVESLMISSGMRAHESVFKGNVPVTLSFVALFIFLFNKYFLGTFYMWAVPDSSVGKESACNAGDPGSIPGLGRSAGEGIGYPLQYSWASLVAQLVKNLPPMWETWVQSLGWEDPLKKGKATHSSILAWRIPETILTIGLQRVRHD